MSHEYTQPEKKKKKGEFKKPVDPKKDAEKWLDTERPTPVVKPKNQVLEDWQNEPLPKPKKE